MSRFAPLERNPVTDYFDTMPNQDKFQGRHILPASSSMGSLMSASISSRPLTPSESPKNPQQIMPVNFGIKYKPAKLGLQYHLLSTPECQLVYEIPLQPFVNAHHKDPQSTEDYVEQLFDLHHAVLSQKVISRKQLCRLVDKVLAKALFLESPNKENSGSQKNNAEKRPQAQPILTSAPATQAPEIMNTAVPANGTQWPTRMLEEERESEISASNGANTDRVDKAESSVGKESEDEFGRDGLDELNYDNVAEYPRAEKQNNSAAVEQLKAGAALASNLNKDESAASLPSNQDPMNQDIFRGNMSNTFKEVQEQLAREDATGQEKDSSFVEMGAEAEADSFNILANSSGANKLVEGYKAAQEPNRKLTVDLGPSNYEPKYAGQQIIDNLDEPLDSNTSGMSQLKPEESVQSESANVSGMEIIVDNFVADDSSHMESPSQKTDTIVSEPQEYRKYEQEDSHSYLMAANDKLLESPSPNKKIKQTSQVLDLASPSQATPSAQGEEEEEDVIDIDDPEDLAAKGLKRITIEGEGEEFLLDQEGNIFNLKGEFVGTADGDIEIEGQNDDSVEQ